MENVLDILQERGYIEQMTHPQEMKELFQAESVFLFMLGLIQLQIVCILVTLFV